jgi:uncharacterized membrane protein
MTTNQHGGSEHNAAQAAEHKKSGNAMAIFAYLWILIIIPFLTDGKNDPFVKYHLKQGLTLIIFEIIGWVVAMLIVWLFWLATLVLAIIGIMNVLNMQEKELPWIGRYAKSFKF